MQVLKKLTASFVLAVTCFAGHAQNGDPTQESARFRGSVTVTGKVIETSTGKPLRGIQVSYKDFSAAISDSLGTFSLRVPSSQVSILLEGEGYQTKEIALLGQTNVRVSMYEDTYTSFYDMAEMPFGPVLKSKTPYSVTSLQTNGNWGHITETPTSYLQGRVSGLNAIRRSGTPNIGATVFLRGMSSLFATNQPLIIVDGVIFNNEDHGGSIIANHYTEPLSTIDVRDIDNISVIRDGSSIYGSKGANGVIIITTARVRELGTKIDLATYGGINFTPDNLPVLKATDYRLLLNDILQSKGLTNAQIQALPYMNDDKTNPNYYTYHNNTDWQKQVLNQSYTKNIYLKVTGGDNIARYALSLGYMNNGGITRNTDLTRYNMRFNGDLNLNRRLTATTNLSFGFNEQNLRDQGAMPKTNPLAVALAKSPLLRIKNVSEKGIESPSFADRDTFGIGNPAVLTDIAQGVNKNYRFLGSIGFNYEINPLLTISTNIGVTNDKVRENFFIPRKGVTSDTLTTDIAFSRLGSQVNSYFALYNDTRLNFSKTFWNVHEVSARLGARYLYGKTEQDYGLGFNSAIDELVTVGNGVTSLRRVGGLTGESNWLNTYFNVDYSYRDKYILSVNVAMDGSSRFGKKIKDAVTINSNKYSLLPSVAGAWLISSEKFMKGFLTDFNFINHLKIRATYGLSGNDDIGNYTSRQTYISQNLLGVQGLVRGGYGNNQLQWEQVHRLSGGLDAALLNERISFSVDAYFDKTRKMIAYEKLPAPAGFDYAITNSGAMTTKGIEASLNARIINKANLKWDIGMMMARYVTVIDKLPDYSIITSFGGATYLTREGGAANLFYGYKTNGVYSSDNEASQAGLGIRLPNGTVMPFTGGDVRFVDVNNDHIIDENDRQLIGDPNPDFFGSISTRVEYKRFSLDALVTYVGGNDVYNYTRNQLESMSGYSNQTEAVVNRWRTNGHQTSMPKAVWGDPMANSRFSDRWIEDGSYIRLRSVTLSYNLSFSRENFLKYITVYLTGNNLLTLTKYKGYDPEFSATESIFGQGVENTLEPLSRTAQAGIRIGL